MFFDRKPANIHPPEDLANLKITDARVGDVLSVTGAGPDFGDLDFKVDRIDEMEAGSRRWVQLSGAWRAHRVFLEVHNQDDVEVFGNYDGRQLTLDELGLSEDDLAQLDARQNQNDFVDYEGKFWLYRFSREIGIFTAGVATGKGFYVWQFQEQDTKRFLSIRKYEGEPFAVNLWTKTEPGDITIYRGS
ncbi:MAG TPA: hypothetical protein VK604_23440 [Bryobacteraceae bacterium]|nr:hypothetical protein [Bryobacteraceae bacterium]